MIAIGFEDKTKHQIITLEDPITGVPDTFKLNSIAFGPPSTVVSAGKPYQLAAYFAYNRQTLRTPPNSREIKELNTNIIMVKVFYNKGPENKALQKLISFLPQVLSVPSLVRVPNNAFTPKEFMPSSLESELFATDCAV